MDLQSTSHSLRSRIVQQRVDLVEFGAVVGDSDHQMHAIHYLRIGIADQVESPIGQTAEEVEIAVRTCELLQQSPAGEA